MAVPSLPKVTTPEVVAVAQKLANEAKLSTFRFMFFESEEEPKMSQPAKICGCSGNAKKVGNPCRPTLQVGSEGGYRRGTGGSSCGKAIGCGCIKPPAQKPTPQKTNVKSEKQ